LRLDNNSSGAGGLGMCIITDENDIVVSVSLIPGINQIPSRFKVYFPFVGDLPCEGDVYKPAPESK
jgi:hypothetical protein